MVVGWFLLIGTLGIQLVGSFDTCTFGETQITYHQDHGVVEGLEDAKVGGMGLWLLLGAAYIGIPFVVAIIFAVIDQWWSKNANTSKSAAARRRRTTS